VVRNVVSIRFCLTACFDTDPALTSEATGFVVDAERGYASPPGIRLRVAPLTFFSPGTSLPIDMLSDRGLSGATVSSIIMKRSTPIRSTEIPSTILAF
jgi:hypothetical protein